MQAVLTELDVGELELAMHRVHEDTPESKLLNLPAEHVEQEREPINENFPFTHSVHDACAVAPGIASTLPAGHPTQVEFHG